MSALLASGHMTCSETLRALQQPPPPPTTTQPAPASKGCLPGRLCYCILAACTLSDLVRLIAVSGSMGAIPFVLSLKCIAQSQVAKSCVHAAKQATASAV